MNQTISEMRDILGSSNKFFSVEFTKRTNNQKRIMLCRTGMNKYKKNSTDESRKSRDIKHDLITVWSVDSFNRNLAKGMDKEQAGFNAWRSIDLRSVSKCSLMKE